MMKFVLVLCVLSVLLLQCQSSPVNLIENHEQSGRALVQGRQQATGINSVAPAAAAGDDDDDDEDDDDDDDEPDLGDLVDDDDDDDDDDDEEDDDGDEEDDTPQGQQAPAAPASDDDEEDDDEDDDYLDRLFDDILGDDDDEDDDDDDEIVQPIAVSSPAVQQTPVAAAPLEDLAPAASSAAVSSAGIGDGIDLPAEAAADALAASGNVADESLGSANNNANNEGALSGGDDDEEEADDEEDDDDDDDIIGDDVIEARREARNLKNNVIDMRADAFQQRHNHFIDAIFARINRIVSDNYDPFVVRLSSRAAAAVLKKAPTTATATTAKPAAYTTKKLKNTKSEPRADVANNMENDKEQSEIPPTPEHQQLQQEHVVANENLTEDSKLLGAPTEMRTVLSASESAATVAKANTLAHNAKKPTTSKNTYTNKPNAKKTAVKNNISRQKLKQGSAVSHPQVIAPGKMQKAEGTLSGLSSLRRVGNVKVIADPEGRNSTIKAKFTLGPLILRVEKSFKRGRVTSVKSATARTNEMLGRIKFSLLNDRATLMSIKVQQPKQVEVESKDNHDRTREFVWRRTPKIARLVSQKLKMAAESVFTPQGVEVVHL